MLDAVARAAECTLVAVVSAPDRPAGRHAAPTPTPVTVRARECGMSVLQPPRVRAPEAVAQIARLAPELGVLADYGQIVPRSVLDLFGHGILNVHPSLLPRWRGASPVAATILAGDDEAGVTIIRMDEGTDSGPVVAAVRWPLRGDETAPELEAAAAEQGKLLLTRSLRPWLGETIAPRPQDDSGVTNTRPLRREDGRLDPSRPAAELERQVRAYQPWPGSYLDTAVGRLIVLRASPAERSGADETGRLAAHGDGLALVAADARLVLEEVQPAGGRRMPGAAFRRGHGRDLPGTAVRGTDDQDGPG